MLNTCGDHLNTAHGVTVSKSGTLRDVTWRLRFLSDTPKDKGQFGFVTCGGGEQVEIADELATCCTHHHMTCPWMHSRRPHSERGCWRSWPAGFWWPEWQASPRTCPASPEPDSLRNTDKYDPHDETRSDTAAFRSLSYHQKTQLLQVLTDAK